MGLGQINGWKTWAGIELSVVDGIAQFFGVVPAVLPIGLSELIPTILIGLGMGDKIGKMLEAEGKTGKK